MIYILSPRHCAVLHYYYEQAASFSRGKYGGKMITNLHIQSEGRNRETYDIYSVLILYGLKRNVFRLVQLHVRHK